MQDHCGRQSWKPLKAEVSDVDCSPVIYGSHHFVIIRNQVGLVWSILVKSLLVVPSHLILCSKTKNVFQETLFNYFPDWLRLTDPQSPPFWPFFEDGCDVCPFPVVRDLPWSTLTFRDDREWPCKDISQLSPFFLGCILSRLVDLCFSSG